MSTEPEFDSCKWLPGHCDACGSADIFYDRADGWTCRSCGRTDSDE